MMKVHFTPHYFHQPAHAITCAIIGAGGTGSCMLLNLARIHVSLVKLGHPGLHVICYDPDIVTEFNVGRQRFSPADIGFNKAAVLVSRLNSYYGLRWDSVPKKYDEAFKWNILISCVDTIASRKVLLEHSRLKINEENTNQREPYNKPYYWMDIGNENHTGQVVLGTVGRYHKVVASEKYKGIVSLPHVFKRFPELKTMKDVPTEPSCSMEQALQHQSLFINSTLAEAGAQIIWSLFRKLFITVCGEYVNLETGTHTAMKVG